MSSMKVSEIFNEEERSAKNEKVKRDSLRTTPRGFYKSKTIQISVPDEDLAIEAIRSALRPWETDYKENEENKKHKNTKCDCMSKVMALVKKECGEEVYLKIQYELNGWEAVKNKKKEEVPACIKSSVLKEVKEAIENNAEITGDLKEKVLWVL